jgi:hypothetical protein
MWKATLYTAFALGAWQGVDPRRALLSPLEWGVVHRSEGCEFFLLLFFFLFFVFFSLFLLL